MKYKVKTFKGRDGWRYHILAGNGKIACVSEAYSSRHAAVRSALAISRAELVYEENKCQHG